MIFLSHIHTNANVELTLHLHLPLLTARTRHEARYCHCGDYCQWLILALSVSTSELDNNYIDVHGFHNIRKGLLFVGSCDYCFQFYSPIQKKL